MRAMIAAAVFIVLLAAPALAQPVLNVQPSDPSHTLRLHLFKNEGVARELAVASGRQSRDLCAKLRAAVLRGELDPQPGHHLFKVRFLNLDFARARGEKITLNSQVFVLPQTFGTSDAQGRTLNEIAIEVENGAGQLGIAERWIREETTLQIICPSGLCAYPPPGQHLQTARGELARRAQEDDTTNFCLVAK